MTQLCTVLYVICDKLSIIHSHNADTLSPLDEDIHVEGMSDPNDIVVCRDDRQLYLADRDCCIWRVSIDDHSYVKWLSTRSTTEKFRVETLSVTSRRLLVTSQWSSSLHQYSTTDRQLLRVVQLPGYVKGLYHGVETTRGTFVVGHYGTSQDKVQSAVSDYSDFAIVLVNVNS